MTITTPTASPFDAIRQIRPDGTEYWSARDLMPLLGYEKWGRFADAIDRAETSAKIQGLHPADHFPGAGKKVQIGSGAERLVQDAHLSRFAAYLVAMNGDPRKPEVAAAQTYFAVRTREAEVAQPLTGPELLARAVLEAADTIKALESRRAELEATVVKKTAELEVATPKAAAWDTFLSSAGDMSVYDAAKALARADVLIGGQRLFKWLLANGWCYRDGDGCPRAMQARIDAKHLHHKPQGHYHPQTGEWVLDAPQVRVTAKGLALLAKRIAEPAEATA